MDKAVVQIVTRSSTTKRFAMHLLSAWDTQLVLCLIFSMNTTHRSTLTIQRVVSSATGRSTTISRLLVTFNAVCEGRQCASTIQITTLAINCLLLRDGRIEASADGCVVV